MSSTDAKPDDANASRTFAPCATIHSIVNDLSTALKPVLEKYSVALTSTHTDFWLCVCGKSCYKFPRAYFLRVG